MNFDEFKKLILGQAVWDIHTHMDINENIRCRDIWDLANYFWFKRELEAVGYPENAMELDEEERYVLFFKALTACFNTSWCWSFKHIALDLYGIEIGDIASLRQLNAAIKVSSQDPNWAQNVCSSLNIQKISMGEIDNISTELLASQREVIPCLNVKIPEICRAILEDSSPRDRWQSFILEYRQKIDAIYLEGYRTVRLEPAPTAKFDKEYVAKTEGDFTQEISVENIELSIWESCFEAFNRNKMNVQLFIGMVRSDANVIVCSPLNDTERVFNLHGLFAKFPNCNFELINAGELSNLDLVQAAIIYKNVYPTGMWWFNCRRSTYMQSMQYRLEALPAKRSILISSDAREIEWEYGKVLFIKTVLTEFLWEQIEKGWLSLEQALEVSKVWLYTAAESLHFTNKN